MFEDEDANGSHAVHEAVGEDGDASPTDSPSLSVPSPARVQELARQEALTPHGKGLRALAKALEPQFAQCCSDTCDAIHRSEVASSTRNSVVGSVSTHSTFVESMSARSSVTFDGLPVTLSSSLPKTPRNCCVEPVPRLPKDKHSAGSQFGEDAYSATQYSGPGAAQLMQSTDCLAAQPAHDVASVDQLEAILQEAGLSPNGTPTKRRTCRLTCMANFGVLFDLHSRSRSLGADHNLESGQAPPGSADDFPLVTAEAEVDETERKALSLWVSGLPVSMPRSLEGSWGSPRTSRRAPGSGGRHSVEFSNEGVAAAPSSSAGVTDDSARWLLGWGVLTLGRETSESPFFPANVMPPAMPSQVPGSSSCMDSNDNHNRSCGGIFPLASVGSNVSARMPPRPQKGGNGRTESDRQALHSHKRMDGCSKLEALLARGRVMQEVAEEELADVSGTVAKCEHYFGLLKGDPSAPTVAAPAPTGAKVGTTTTRTQIFRYASDFLDAFRTAWTEVLRNERWAAFLPQDMVTPTSTAARSPCTTIASARVREPWLNRQETPPKKTRQLPTSISTAAPDVVRA